MQQQLAWNLIRLARPHQWAKAVFVVIGPAYGIATTSGKSATLGLAVALAGAVIAFCLAASSCYIFNDIRDREADQAHPRKRNRPVASGAVHIPTAAAFAVVLAIAAALACLLPWLGQRIDAGNAAALPHRAGWLLLAVAVYIANTTLYSAVLKHHAVLDVIGLAAGFVLRVLGGCAATGVVPSPFLLNVTFFLSMFLAFGKRLGERRTMGDDAAAARSVQGAYSGDFLRMAVVVTGVATLVTYASYIEGHPAPDSTGGFNLLWLTLLPATYGLLRCMILLEHGRYDDPTEMATKDRPMQLAVAVFVFLTIMVMWWVPPSG